MLAAQPAPMPPYLSTALSEHADRELVRETVSISQAQTRCRDRRKTRRR